MNLGSGLFVLWFGICIRSGLLNLFGVVSVLRSKFIWSCCLNSICGQSGV